MHHTTSNKMTLLAAPLEWRTQYVIFRLNNTVPENDGNARPQQRLPMNSLMTSLIRWLALSLFLGAACTAHANDHGGGGGAAGPEPMQFTVNVGDTGSALRVLQLTMVLEFAKPEASHHLSEIKPKVQHRIILLLSGENVSSLKTLQGKKELQERIVADLNELIDETPKTGVKEVLFTNFIIQ